MNAIINMMNRPHTMEQDATVVMVIISTCTVEKWMLPAGASFHGEHAAGSGGGCRDSMVDRTHTAEENVEMPCLTW